MSKRIRMPGRLNVSMQLFGRFTPLDLLRLFAPIGAVLLIQGGTLRASTESIALLLAAVATGLVWYIWRPWQQPLDYHVYRALTWLASRDDQGVSKIDLKDDGRYVSMENYGVAVVKVSPVNLEMLSQSQKGALHSIQKELLESITYPISIHSEQEELDLSKYKKEIKNRDSVDSRIQDGYVDFIDDFADNSLTTTQHYVSVHVSHDDLSWLLQLLPDPITAHLPISPETSDEKIADELNNRCREIINILDTADLSAERVTHRELEDRARTVSTPNPGPTYTTRPHEEIGEYRKTIYIEEFPSSLEFAWTLQLLRTTGRVSITQTIKPKNSGKTTTRLQRLSERLNAEISSVLRNGYRGTNQLERRLNDTEWLLDLLADRKSKAVEYGVYITAHGTSREECDQTFEQICNRLQTLQIDYRVPIFRTNQAFQTNSLLHPDPLQESMLAPTSSAAAGFPYGTQSVQSQTGVIHGVDTSDETPVLLDRYQWSNHSTAIMGTSGSGKSYRTKIEILRTFLAYDDVQIYVIDPKKEYSHLIKRLDGDVHTLTPDSLPEFDSDSRITGFEVAERGQVENDEPLVDIVEKLYTKTSQNQKKTLVLIDEARILMNEPRGRRILRQFVLEARDTNTAVTLVTQNASDFTNQQEGEDILKNTPAKFLMRHEEVPTSVVTYFNLSQREEQELYKLKDGNDSPYSEALLKVSKRLDAKIRINSTGQEHAIIETTNREEAK